MASYPRNQTNSATGRQTLLYILSGPDDFSLTQSLEEIKRSTGDQEMLATNTTTLEGQQMSLAEFSNACGTLPFLSEKRLVIVKGLLERFEPKGRTGRQKKSKQTTSEQNGYKEVADCISNMPDSTILVLTESQVKSSNPLYKMISRQAVVKSFPLLRGTELRQWIEKRVAEEGGSISPPAVNLLTQLIGSNLWTMTSEINKLVLFAGERRIEKEDVQKLVGYTQQVSVFAMVDAVIEFRPQVAENILEQLLQRGATPPYILVMLSRQIRMIVRAKELRSQGIGEREIQSKLGLASDFQVCRTLEQANRYTLARLKQVYRQLLEADLSIKTGKYEGELALNILIAELCQRRMV